MNPAKANRRGWGVVVGAMLCLMVGNGPIMQFPFGVLLKPVSQDLGWARSSLALALTCGLTLTALCSPAMGALVDRYGTRRVTPLAILALSLALAATGLFAHSRASFIGLYALMGIAAAGQTPLPYTKVVAAWFDQRRGLALGLATGGVGLGTSLVPLYTQWVVTHYSWHAAYVALGALTALVALPCLLTLVRMPAAHGGARTALNGVSRREALRAPGYWLIALSFVLISASTNGAIAHVVPLLTDRGFASTAAGRVMASVGLAMIAGRVGSGFLADRWFAPFVIGTFACLSAIGTVVLIFAGTLMSALVAVILIGVGLGAEIDMGAFLLSRYFGLRAFGELYGYLIGLFMFGAGIGPWLMSLWFDAHGHSYAGCLVLFAAGLLIASLLLLRLGPYRYADHVAIADPAGTDPAVRLVE